MKVPTKFVKSLSPADQNMLVVHHQSSESFRVRNRAHAVLLSADGFPIAEIAKICRVDRDTVSVWIDNWNSLGETGLADEERSGRPPLLTPDEQEKALVIALRNPRFPHRQLNAIKEESGKQLSRDTLKRLIKKKTISGKE